jgi:hypothetical protein
VESPQRAGPLSLDIEMQFRNKSVSIPRFSTQGPILIALAVKRLNIEDYNRQQKRDCRRQRKTAYISRRPESVHKAEEIEKLARNVKKMMNITLRHAPVFFGS